MLIQQTFQARLPPVSASLDLARISGQTQAKLTLKQLKKMAKLLGIERIEDLPDDFAPTLLTLPSDVSEDVDC